MRSLSEVFASPAELLAATAEDLATTIPGLLKDESAAPALDRRALNQELLSGFATGPSEAAMLRNCVAEALGWLVAAGLLCESPLDTPQPTVLFVTRKARDWPTTSSAASVLPRALVHPAVASRCLGAFSRGEYDNAVFLAFKALEVEVRNAASASHDLIGTNLMSYAFHPHTGPLSRRDSPVAEREAIRNLYVGAMGHGKNPHSHRDEPLTAENAALLLLFASYLLNLLDARTTPQA